MHSGRLCYGSHGLHYLPDPKGIIGKVQVNSQIVKKWDMYPLNDKVFLRHVNLLDPIFTTEHMLPHGPAGNAPKLYSASFDVKMLGDTYIKMTGWSKGQVFINKFNIGRYWHTQKGPQKTLYAPENFLISGTNCVMILELDKATCDNELDNECFVEFVDKPILV